MNPAEFQPPIPANERPQAYDIDSAATGNDGLNLITRVTKILNTVRPMLSKD
jgi:hypothetical protein